MYPTQPLMEEKRLESKSSYKIKIYGFGIIGKKLGRFRDKLMEICQRNVTAMMIAQARLDFQDNVCAG